MNDPQTDNIAYRLEGLRDRIESEVKHGVLSEAKEYLAATEPESLPWQKRMDSLDVFPCFERLAALVIAGDTLGALRYIQQLATENEIESRMDSERWSVM